VHPHSIANALNGLRRRVDDDFRVLDLAVERIRIAVQVLDASFWQPAERADA
jgi:hypothetical protein